MKPPMQIVPMCDVAGQYRSLQTEIDAAVLRVLGSGQVIGGPEVAEFERAVADYCGTTYALGCSSGTDALVLALHALGVGPGDEVIVPPFTFFATASAVCRLGARPVFSDIDPVSYNLDPNQIEDKITARTKAIVPVHLFGQAAEMSQIRSVARSNGVYVVEDAAQSFGADYAGVRCGNLGDVAAFSFYPSKNLGALGDAGLVTTNREDWAKKMGALRTHGSEVRYLHKYIGYNMRLDAIQAAVLRVKLPHVDCWLVQRIQAASRYDQMLEEAGLVGFVRRPSVMPGCRHTFNQYVIRVPAEHRDPLVQHLRANGVSCDIYYPLPLHLQECFRYLDHQEGDFPVSEEACRTVLALPIFPEITAEQQLRVVETLSGYARQSLRKAA